MLSRKQIWRKAPTSTSRLLNRQPHGMDDEEILAAHFNAVDISSIQPPLFIHQNSITAFKRRKSRESSQAKITVRSSNIITLNNTSKRSVSFSQYVEVCLIPRRSELLYFGLDLFWTSEDCSNFKRDATEEIRAYCKANCCSAKEAIKALYQPADELIISNIIDFPKLHSFQSQSTESTEATDVESCMGTVSSSSKSFDDSPLDCASSDCQWGNVDIDIPSYALHSSKSSSSSCKSKCENGSKLHFSETDVELLHKENCSNGSSKSNGMNSPKSSNDNVKWERKWSVGKIPRIILK